MQQRYRLRNRQFRVTSQEQPKVRHGCPPSPYHYPPRRSGRSRTYAGLAIAKGNCTRATTRWPAIGQEFSPFLLKRAPFGVFLPVGSVLSSRPLNGGGYPERSFYEPTASSNTAELLWWTMGAC